MSDWLENLKRYALSDDMDYRLTWEDAGSALEEIERLQKEVGGLSKELMLHIKAGELSAAKNERLRSIVNNYRLGKHWKGDEIDGIIAENERLRAVLESVLSHAGDEIPVALRREVGEALQEGE